MWNLAQSIVSGCCLLLAAFSVFGFLATFEPGVELAWRVGYLTLFVVSLIGASMPWTRVDARG
jgi:hypothetical protein